MSVSPAAARRQRQRAEARRAILEATEALLLEEGYERFSMRRLAERCGYTAPTIYHYFGDKPGLIDALLEERFALLLRQIRRVPRDPDPAEYMRSLARAFVRFGLRNPTFYRLLMTPRPEEGTPPHSAEQARAVFEGPVYELARSERLHTDDVEVAKQALWALLHGVISLSLSRPDYPWSKDLVEVALETMLRGMLRASTTEQTRPASGVGG
jgi:AcrR family transcriptional regulator